MKIAVSAVGASKESMMDTRFGRCEFFVIYDTEIKEFTSIENEGLKASGGAGVKAANSILEYDVDAVVTGNLGPNASDVLKMSDIKLYTSDVKSIESIAKDFEEDKLIELTTIGPSKAGYSRFRGE